MSELASKLSEFSSCYEELHFSYLEKVGLPTNFEKIKDEPLSAILYLTIFVHERGGVNPEFPKYHRVAIKRCLNGEKFSRKLLDDRDFPRKVWAEFERLAEGKSNEMLTEGVICGILKEMQKRGEPNIAALLGKMSLGEARKFLLSFQGIGPKLSAFVLRDFWCFLRLWKVREGEIYMMQPVDRWVMKISSELCWPNDDWEKKAPSTLAKHDRYAKKIAEHCLEGQIDPVRFNQGAWFVGSYYQELCRFHDIEEEQSLDRKTCIEMFDIDRVVEGIKGCRALGKKIFCLR